MSTLTQLRSKIRIDIDMQESDLISDSELNSYINDGISEAEKLILTLHEDYFLDSTTLSLVTGTSSYSLPSDIFANKIRRIFYDNSSNERYEIMRIRDLKDTVDVDLSSNYSYLITNDSTNGIKLVLYPTSRVTNSTYATVWYIRNAKQLKSANVSSYVHGTKTVTTSAPHGMSATDAVLIYDASSNYFVSDTIATVPTTTTFTLTTGNASIANGYFIDVGQCDIPEFETFVIWYAKVMCLEKDGVSPMLPNAQGKLAVERQLMVETLTNMVVDENNEVLSDLRFYDDFYEGDKYFN